MNIKKELSGLPSKMTEREIQTGVLGGNGPLSVCWLWMRYFLTPGHLSHSPCYDFSCTSTSAASSLPSLPLQMHPQISSLCRLTSPNFPELIPVGSKYFPAASLSVSR